MDKKNYLRLHGWISLSQMCATSNFALFQTFFPVLSAFYSLTPYKCLAIQTPLSQIIRYLELFFNP